MCSRSSADLTHRMPTDDRGEYRRVHDPQIRDSVHAQERVHNTPFLLRRHARRARGVVQRLDLTPDRLRDRGVVEVVERMVKRSIFRARRVHHRRERLSVQDAREQARGADEDGDVVGRGEVLRVYLGWVLGVARLEPDRSRACWPVGSRRQEGRNERQGYGLYIRQGVHGDRT